MLPDRVSNPGPLTYESGALPIALRGPAPVWEIAVHLAVACYVFIDVSLYCPFFPRDVFDGIWDLIGSVSEGFPTYLCRIYYYDLKMPHVI